MAKFHVSEELLDQLVKHGLGQYKAKSKAITQSQEAPVTDGDSCDGSALVGTPWEDFNKVREKMRKEGGKLPPRNAGNNAPDPPSQLPPPIKIIWQGAVYDGIPQNDADSSKSLKPFFLAAGKAYQGWLNFADAVYDYRTLNDNGEGGILMYPCTREQGRKGGFADRSRVYNAEYKPWFMFGIDRSTGSPNFNCCKSGGRKKDTTIEAEEEKKEEDIPDRKTQPKSKKIQGSFKKDQKIGAAQNKGTTVTGMEVELTGDKSEAGGKKDKAGIQNHQADSELTEEDEE